MRVSCALGAVKDMDGDNACNKDTDLTLAERMVEVVVDRSPLDLTGGAIKILSWKEITE